MIDASKEQQDKSKPVVDVTEQQLSLLDAEDASLVALEQSTKASAACVAFIRKLGLSVAHPKVQELVARIPGVVSDAARLPDNLSECHRLAQKLAQNCTDKDVHMSGGVPKGDIPAEHA